MAKQSVEQAVSEFRSTAMQGQLSPAEMFFGRRLRGELPELRTHVDMLDGAHRREDMRSAYLGAGANIRSSPPLVVGEYVWMQNHKSLRWNIAAKVIKVRPGNKSYWVMVVTGETFLRNRMFLRKWNDRNAKNAPGMQFHQTKQPETQQEVEPASQVLTRRMTKNAEVDKARNATSGQVGNRNLHFQRMQHQTLKNVQTSSNAATPHLSNRNAHTWKNSADQQLRNKTRMLLTMILLTLVMITKTWSGGIPATVNGMSRNAKSRQIGNQNLHGQQVRRRNLRTVQTSSNSATPQLSNRNAQPRNVQTWENSADQQLRNQNAQHGNAWTHRNSTDQRLRNKSVTHRHSRRQHGKQHSWENGHSPGQQTRNNPRNYKNKARSGQQGRQTHGIYGGRRQEYFSSSSASNWRRPTPFHFCSVSTLQQLESDGQHRVSGPGHRPGHGNGSDPRGVSHWFGSEVSGDRSRLDNPDSFRWNSL